MTRWQACQTLKNSMTFSLESRPDTSGISSSTKLRLLTRQIKVGVEIERETTPPPRLCCKNGIVTCFLQDKNRRVGLRYVHGSLNCTKNPVAAKLDSLIGLKTCFLKLFGCFLIVSNDVHGPTLPPPPRSLPPPPT